MPSYGTGLRAGSLPCLELGANGEALVEELSVHQLAQELQERTDRLMQLDTLAELEALASPKMINATRCIFHMQNIQPS